MCITKLIAESDFALSLLKQLPLDKPTVFSPASIALALALCHSGAKGNTREEIEQAVLKGVSNEDFTAHFAGLIGQLQSAQEGVVFDIANRVYVKDSFEISADYLAEVEKSYQAKAQNLDFGNGAESAKIVNGFVNETTHGKIDKIVEDDSFSDAVAFLVNALYMKADWQHKFYGGMTRQMEFHSAEGVNREEYFLYDSEVNRDFFEDEQVQVLSLKYTDTSYAFNIILPKERFGLAAIKENLTGERLQELLGNVKNSFVNVRIPKLKVEGDLGLVGMLRILGINDLFSDEKANLTGIGAGGLFVSDAKHKAVVEVDEDGTTAAAVTAMKIGLECAMEYLVPPIEFHADHPFIFVITKNTHPVDEDGTTAAAVTAMKVSLKCMRFPAPVQFTANHPFIFAITKDNHPVFVGQYL